MSEELYRAFMRNVYDYDKSHEFWISKVVGSVKFELKPYSQT